MQVRTFEEGQIGISTACYADQQRRLIDQGSAMRERYA